MRKVMDFFLRLPVYVWRFLCGVMWFFTTWASLNPYGAVNRTPPKPYRPRERRLWGHFHKEGKTWAEARAWLYAWCLTFGFEWHLFTRKCGIELAFCDEGDDADITSYLQIPFIGSFYFAIDGLRYRLGWKWMPADRKMGFYIADWCLWLHIWATEDWYRDAPWWSKTKCVHFDNLLFGKYVYNEKLLDENVGVVTFPEGSYNLTIRLIESSWSWPRWWTHRIRRAVIDAGNGIPIPGKGSEAYNCGDDAIRGLTCEATTFEEAIARLRESVEETRQAYGWATLPERILKRRA